MVLAGIIVFTRFSTVGGESGSADAARDPRGFAIKHYTEEGIYDMVGNNTPIFFIRDPIKFPGIRIDSAALVLSFLCNNCCDGIGLMVHRFHPHSKA